MSSPVELYTITEGPTDVVVVTAVLDAMGQPHVLHTLQPEGDGLDGLVDSEHGLGWRDGVRAFCQSEHEAIDVARAQGVVVIQIDADVARKNKPDFDRDLTRHCPPARDTCEEVRREICAWLGAEKAPDGVVLCVPAQAMETWVVKALDPTLTDVVRASLNSRIARAQNRDKPRLRALGLVGLLECHDNPEAWLARVTLTKTPKDYEAARAHLVAGWQAACELPEAQRFEDELRPSLVSALLSRGL